MMEDTEQPAAITPDGEHEAAEMVAAAILLHGGVRWNAVVSHATLAPIVRITAGDGRRYQLICTEDVDQDPTGKDTNGVNQTTEDESTPCKTCDHSEAEHAGWALGHLYRPAAQEAAELPVNCRTGLCEHQEHWGAPTART